MAANITWMHALKVLLSPHYAARTGLELVRIASGYSVQATPAEAQVASTADPGIDVFFQDTHPLSERGTRRWNREPRRLAHVTAYGFHTTAVNGGFGVAKYQYSKWMKTWDQLERAGFIHKGNPPSERRDNLVPWQPANMTRDEARLAWAKVMGIRTRYLNLPYHSISASRLEELIVNHRVETHTWHGNGMNRYTWGHAMDDVWSEGEEVASARIQHELAALERVHKIVYDAGGRPKYCETHSQHARKPNDPGMPFVEMVMLPFAKEHGLTIRAAARSGSGKALTLPR